MVTQDCNQETETGELWVPGQPDLYRKIQSQKSQKQTNKQKTHK